MTLQSPTVSPTIDSYRALLEGRFSCRGYLPTEVPQPVIEEILALAQRTASWCNSQPWKVTITRGAATERYRTALSAEAERHPEGQSDLDWPREYRGVYLDRRRVCGFQLYDAVGVRRGDRVASARQSADNYRLFGAPHVAIVTTDEALGPYGAVDCGAFVSNFMLAARSLGVASIAQAALARHSRFVRGHFGISDDRLMVCGISFGYEDPAHPANGFRTGRAPLPEVATFLSD